MTSCETMVKLVCKASRLKSDCYQYHKDNLNTSYCVLCGILAIEDAEHIILHCHYMTDLRNQMFAEIEKSDHTY